MLKPKIPKKVQNSEFSVYLNRDHVIHTKATNSNFPNSSPPAYSLLLMPCSSSLTMFIRTAVPHTCMCTWEVEAGGPGAQGQPQLHETLTQSGGGGSKEASAAVDAFTPCQTQCIWMGKRVLLLLKAPLLSYPSLLVFLRPSASLHLGFLLILSFLYLQCFP